MIHIQNELKAMADTYSIISQLSITEQNRVIEWLLNKVNEKKITGEISENGNGA